MIPQSLSLSASAPSISHSFSTNVCEIVEGNHLFKCIGYSLSRKTRYRKFTSSEFVVEGFSWVIELSYEDSYLSLFIVLLPRRYVTVQALLKLELLDQSGAEQHNVRSLFEPNSSAYKMNNIRKSWGSNQFISIYELETGGYLKDDCLQVRCTVGVVKDRTEIPQEIPQISVPSSNMGEQFTHLLESGEGADVKLEVDGQVFSAHKVVLAARSPVFWAQFFGPMKDGSSHLIKVEDIESPVFKILLDFIYSDCFPELEELSGLNSELDSTLMCQHLLAAADRYGLDRLKLLCERNLCTNVAIKTVATTLALAEQHQCYQLKAESLKFVAMPKNIEAVVGTDGFDFLKKSCPGVLDELVERIVGYSNYGSIMRRLRNKVVPDGRDGERRRVKQRVSLNLDADVIALSD